VTVTRYGIRSPHSKKSPSVGTWIVIAGDVLPTVMIVVLTSWAPLESLTVSLAV
jgi:hypothetical protein